jgi:D-alanyl-D-alanine carboxypeptidase/D-alanyl-D-alanine-endopeptidase (penicillin-binding protein 4)
VSRVNFLTGGWHLSLEKVPATCLAVALAGCAHTPPTVAPRMQQNPRAERQLVSDLDHIFNAPAMEQAVWGVEVKSLDTGRVLYTRNPRTLLMPASNMKILTLAAAAQTFGWDYRFKTVLETAAPIEDGVLKGDLIVRGAGDPSINARGGRAAAVFDSWAIALQGAGINSIDGAIIGDDNAFDDAWLGAGWAWDYLQYGYAAPIGALEYDEDTAELTIRPGARVGDPVFVAIDAGSGLRLINRATTIGAGGANSIDFERHINEDTLEVTGSLAVDAQPVDRAVAVVNPTVYFAQALKDALIAHGITVRGDTLDADDIFNAPAPAARRVLIETESPPLRDIATTMMKVSQNLYAETLFKALATANGGLGTAEGGRTIARGVLGSWGIPDTTYVQLDGSGLSRYDYVTADLIVAILDHMFHDPKQHDAFLATLPIAGQDGTMASRLKHTRADGNSLAKTGSISNVRTVSGYVKTRDGETLAFSILANNFTIPAGNVTWMADLAIETLANYTHK